LNDKSYIAFEIGYDEASKVSNLLNENGYSDIKVLKDLSNNDRVIIARRIR